MEIIPYLSAVALGCLLGMKLVLFIIDKTDEAREKNKEDLNG